MSCGLCCDGTLFGLVRVDASEAAHATRHRLHVVSRDDGTFRLQQPCAALDGTVCRIYDDRPATCRRYFCDLAAALEGSELSLGEALALVRDTRAMAHSLAALLPAVDAGAMPRRVQQRAREAHRPQSGQPLSHEALERLCALEERLDHVFRGRRG